jgi:hypothetical protein
MRTTKASSSGSIRGTPWGLAPLGTVKLLGHELTVPGQDRVGLDEARHFRQGSLPQLLADRGQRRAFAIRQPHTARDLTAQDAIFRNEISITQQQFLIDGPGDIRQQVFPVHAPSSGAFSFFIPGEYP